MLRIFYRMFAISVISFYLPIESLGASKVSEAVLQLGRVTHRQSLKVLRPSATPLLSPLQLGVHERSLRVLSTATSAQPSIPISETFFRLGEKRKEEGLIFKDSHNILMDTSQSITKVSKQNYTWNDTLTEDKPIRCLRQAINVMNHLEYVPFLQENRTYAKDIKVEHPTFGIFFRGGTCDKGKEYPLLPAIMRKSNINEVSPLKHIQSLHPRTMGRESFLGQLSYAQHYGLPTRLLDFSTNILKALYFAVSNAEMREENKDKSYGELYILNAFSLNKSSRIFGQGLCTESDYDAVLRTAAAFFHTDDELLNSEVVAKAAKEASIDRDLRKKDAVLRTAAAFLHTDDELLNSKVVAKAAKEASIDRDLRKKFEERFHLPVAIFPNVLHERIRVQDGTFVVFGGMNPEKTPEDSIVRTFLQNHCMYARVENRFHIRKELEQIGIHEASIYPELEKQMAYIKKVWSTPT